MIPFPKLHIAASVLNRIQNTLEEQGPLGLGDESPQLPLPMMPPIAPDPTGEGLALGEQLSQPPAPISAPPGSEDGMLEESVLGGSPFDGALV